MKTNSIYQKKALKIRTLILVFVLLPLIDYAGMPMNSNLVSDFGDQSTISMEEKRENWMTDVTTWLNEECDNMESEEEMAIEEWMVDVNDRSWKNEVVEEEIQIEDWMDNVKDFSSRLNFDEEEIEIENWMCNPSSWQEKR